MKKKILWSDEPQFLIHVRGKPSTTYHLHNTIPTVKHGGGSIMQWGCFSVAGTGEVIREDGKLKAAKYRDIVNESLVQSGQNLRLAESSPSNMTITLRTQPRQCKERQRDDSINVLEWPSQSWDLEPISLKQFNKTQQNKMWKKWRGMQTFCRHSTCSHTFF